MEIQRDGLGPVMIKTSLILILALALGGRSSIANRKKGDERSVATLIQYVLDAIVPPGFTGGDFDAAENIPMYVTFTLKAGNLKRNEAGMWTFTWLEYDRTGPLTTSAHIRLGKRP